MVDKRNIGMRNIGKRGKKVDTKSLSASVVVASSTAIPVTKSEAVKLN